MSVIDTLICDRTQADVAALEGLLAKAKKGALTDAELASFHLASSRGAYNHTDLNRVTAAMDHIHARLTGCGYATGYAPVRIPHRDGTSDTLWREDDEGMGAELFAAYLANLGRLRAVLAVLPDTPSAPDDMDGLTTQEANAIEKILVDLDGLLVSMREVMLHAAQPFLCCGYAVYLAKEHLQVCTADGLPVDTADGKPVYAW